MRPKQSPSVSVTPDQVWLNGGLDLISPPGFAKPGTCRFALNYEAEFGGGYRRVGGFERLDGRPAPSNAEYVVLGVAPGHSLTIAMTVIGATSGAEGKIVWISPDLLFIGLTRLLPGFVFDEEDLEVASSVVATVTNSSPSIDAFVDNDIAYAAAEEYRVVIQQPPGQYGIRGVAVIANLVFCWRDDGAAMKLYKSSATGWVLVDLGYRVAFNTGTTEYVDGNSLVQGGVATFIRRVVVTEGTWAAGTAAGYFVIDLPIGGSFVAGAAAGTGVCSLTGPELPIQLLANGRVQTVVHSFGGAEGTRRLYGCDGVNAEFEFDGTVYVPIETGMGNIRADHVSVHKNHLFFAYGPSLQHSGVVEPYRWSPIFGAGELTTGDQITNLIAVSGSETSAALMVTCRNSAFALYGNSSADWDFRKVSEEAGAQAYSGVQFPVPMAFDRDGFNKYSPTQAFGNFSFDSASQEIEPLVKNASVMCSVLAKNRSTYRCFFSDGLFVTGTPKQKGIAWMPCDYGRIIAVVIGGEIAGQYRVFAGDTDGWVIELDVGRNFDGAVVDAGMRLSSMNQKSPVVEKQYRYLELQTEASSAFALAVGTEYSDSTPEDAQLTQSEMIDFKKQYGTGLYWDFNAWDRAYWDGSATNMTRYDIHGLGRSISILFSSISDRELPHFMRSSTVLFTQRRLGR